jgi:hypothetical protein
MTSGVVVLLFLHIVIGFLICRAQICECSAERRNAAKCTDVSAPVHSTAMHLCITFELGDPYVLKLQ